MADEFDAFDSDFDDSMEDFDFDQMDPEDFEDQPGEENSGSKDKNPLNALVKKISSVSKPVLIAIIAVPVIIIVSIILMRTLGDRGIPDEIEIPYYYSPKEEYRFKLDDEFVEGKIPYIRLKLELVFDNKYKDTSKVLDSAYYQIREDVVSRFKENITYDDLKANDSQKRHMVYKDSMEYINRLIGDPIVKEIMEVQFETSLVKTY